MATLLPAADGGGGESKLAPPADVELGPLPSSASGLSLSGSTTANNATQLCISIPVWLVLRMVALHGAFAHCLDERDCEPTGSHFCHSRSFSASLFNFVHPLGKIG